MKGEKGGGRKEMKDLSHHCQVSTLNDNTHTFHDCLCKGVKSASAAAQGASHISGKKNNIHISDIFFLLLNTKRLVPQLLLTLNKQYM